jgi:hypothetical protein
MFSSYIDVSKIKHELIMTGGGLGMGGVIVSAHDKKFGYGGYRLITQRRRATEENIRS